MFECNCRGGVSPPERNFTQKVLYLNQVGRVIMSGYLKMFFVCKKDVLFFLLQKEAKTGGLRFPPNPLKRFSCVYSLLLRSLFGCIGVKKTCVN